MIELDDTDLDVLALLAQRPLHNPPPLVLEVIKELQSWGLTFYAVGCWHATALGLDALARHRTARAPQD